MEAAALGARRHARFVRGRCQTQSGFTNEDEAGHPKVHGLPRTGGPTTGVSRSTDEHGGLSLL